MALDIQEFYHKCLIPLTPSTPVSKIIELVMTGGETVEDFAQLLALDSELQHWVRLTVQRLGFEKRANRLDQMITLLGLDRVRDLIIGRTIERKFLLPSETLIGKLQAAREKDAEKAAGKKGGAAAAEPEAEAGAMESVPALAEFGKYLEYAKKAEEVAISIRNSYPGQAFAGGVSFDYMRHFLKSVKLDKLKESRLKRTDTFLEEIFQDGLRCGIAANEIIQKISIANQKTVFVTALVHNIGKALLLAYDPSNYERAYLVSTGAPAGEKVRLSATQAEQDIFELDHAQAGSLYLGRLPYLQEIERSVDYHDNPHLLRFSNPNLYALSCLLRVSSTLAALYQKSRKVDPDVEKVPDQRITASAEFAFLKLTIDDWQDIKANFALKLMKVQL